MVPVYIMFFLSARGTSLETGLVCLSTAIDSPVSVASFTFKFDTSISLASAGTLSPVSRSSISPGTIFLVGISLTLLSRLTLALGAAIRLRASIAFSARVSCVKPTTALSNSTPSITPASMKCSTTIEIIAARRSTYISGLRNCLRKTSIGGVFFLPFNSLGPY